MKDIISLILVFLFLSAPLTAQEKSKIDSIQLNDMTRREIMNILLSLDEDTQGFQYAKQSARNRGFSIALYGVATTALAGAVFFTFLDLGYSSRESISSPTAWAYAIGAVGLSAAIWQGLRSKKKFSRAKSSYYGRE